MNRALHKKKLYISLSVASLLFGLGLFGTLVYMFIDPIYHGLAFKAIGDKRIAWANAKTPEEKVEAISRYMDNQVRPQMLPAFGLSAFKYLEYGYTYCDSQADITMNLLYYQGITSRVVPLYDATGHSNHTIMEWFNGTKWLLLDPINDLNIRLTAKELLTLPKEEVITKSDFTSDSYDQYKKTYFDEIQETYKDNSYVYWGPLAQKKVWASRAFDTFAIPLAARLVPSSPHLAQAIYIRKHYRDNSLESQYLIARNKRLLWNYNYALNTYNTLLTRPDVSEDWPGFERFSINKKMLDQRIELTKKRLEELSQIGS